MSESSILSFDKNHTKYILCDCRSEILVIDYDMQSRTADLAIYENFASYSNKSSWNQKIRYIWRILCNQYPYNDQIILNQSQIKDLSKFLVDMTSK